MGLEMAVPDPSKIYYVYGLHYPDGRLFYIGKGQRGRMYQHITEARIDKCTNKLLQHIITKIENCGGKVLFKKFVTGLSSEDAIKQEAELIALHGRRRNKTGCLANLTDGGEGTAGYRFTDEAKKKMSDRHKGNTYRRGAKLSDEQIKGMSERMMGKQYRKGQTHTEEAKVKIKAKRSIQAPTFLGNHHSEEAKAKMSASRSGRPAWNKGMSADPTKIKTMNDKWRGSKQTPEAIAKISAAGKATWAKRRAEACNG